MADASQEVRSTEASAGACGARDGTPSAVRVRNLAPQCGVAPTEVAEAAGAERSYTVLDLITSLSGDELRSVMTSCLNHTEVLLPAGLPKRPEHDLKALITKRQDFR